MSILNELGITDMGDRLRGLTTETNMKHNNFNISCGCATADQLISGLNAGRLDNEGNEGKYGGALDVVHVNNFYLNEEISVPLSVIDSYRVKDIEYGEEYNLLKNQNLLSPEERKKAYSGEEDHIKCGRFPHLKDCDCKYPCALLLPKIHPLEVIDKVFVGPIETALKTKELIFMKITHILNLSNIAYYKRNKYFQYFDICINDVHTENAIKFFKITNRFIAEALNSGGKILIHSENGISRCWVFLMAYLIGRKGMIFTDAYKLVRDKFHHVEPNDNFLTQLKHYDLKVNF